MTKEYKSRHVAFVYIGPLQTRGRLLKQIATLQDTGVNCEVFLGNTEIQEPDPKSFDFPIHAEHVNHGSGKLMSFINQMRFCRKAASLILKSEADTVVCLALESLMAGVWAKRKRPGLKLIFDNNELHLESYGPGIKYRIWRPIHNRGILECDAIFHAEANRMAYFLEHYDTGDVPHHVLENFPSYVQPSNTRCEPTDEVRVIYLGGFGEGRFTLEIMQAFAEMPESIRLDIVGAGHPEFLHKAQELLKELDVEHVRLLPPIPYKQIPELLTEYHIGVALYRNTNLNNFYCAPNKVYDYLMNGLPVITNRYPGLVSVIEDNDVGACLAEVNKDSIREAVDTIVERKCWNNITDVLRHRYCWEAQVAGYLKVFGHDTSLAPPTSESRNQ